MSYVRRFPEESFDELLTMLEQALLPQILNGIHKSIRELLISDAELNDDCNLDLVFQMDEVWKDVDGADHHDVYSGIVVIDYTKKRVSFPREKCNTIMNFNDNYYQTTYICQIAEELANRIFDH